MLALVRLLARQAAREAFDQAVAEFDIVMAEALDRFSRDQEDTAGLFKRLTFAGVNIVTLAEGDITHLHIGLKGTTDASTPVGASKEDPTRTLWLNLSLGKAGGLVVWATRVRLPADRGTRSLRSAGGPC